MGFWVTIHRTNVACSHSGIKPRVCVHRRANGGPIPASSCPPEAALAANPRFLLPNTAGWGRPTLAVPYFVMELVRGIKLPPTTIRPTSAPGIASTCTSFQKTVPRHKVGFGATAAIILIMPLMAGSGLNPNSGSCTGPSPPCTRPYLVPCGGTARPAPGPLACRCP